MQWVVRFFQDRNDPSNKDIIDDFDFENKNKEEITTMIETLPGRLVEQGFVKGLAKGEVLGLLKGMNIIYPGIIEKYKERVDNAQAEAEFQSLEKEILQDIESRKKD